MSNNNHAPEQVEVVCDKHGKFIAKQVPSLVPNGKPIVISRCPKCVEESEAESKRYQQEAEERMRLDRIRVCVEQFKRDIPKRFKECDFSNYVPTCPQSVAQLKSIKSYAANFDALSKRGAGLIFCGDLGTGKTHLAIAIGKEVAKLGVDARYTNLIDMIRAIRATWRNEPGEKTEEMVLNSLANYGLLIIDEIGVQNGTENERTLLFDVINSRYENMLPTIIISNLNPTEIATLISARSVDRITDGGGGTVVFNWGSYRNRGAA